jgi:hypothetical protein
MIEGSDIIRAALFVLPCLVMMPGMGMGIAASRTPTPNVARLKGVARHSVFGVGTYPRSGLVAAKG